MYCPTCGNQFSEGQKYCRTCGTNLTIISKAVTLSETIARSDRGPLPKIRAGIVMNLKHDQVTTEISKGLEQMTHEIESGFHASPFKNRQRRSPSRPPVVDEDRGSGIKDRGSRIEDRRQNLPRVSILDS